MQHSACMNCYAAFLALEGSLGVSRHLFLCPGEASEAAMGQLGPVPAILQANVCTNLCRQTGPDKGLVLTSTTYSTPFQGQSTHLCSFSSLFPQSCPVHPPQHHPLSTLDLHALAGVCCSVIGCSTHCCPGTLVPVARGVGLDYLGINFI